MQVCRTKVRFLVDPLLIVNEEPKMITVVKWESLKSSSRVCSSVGLEWSPLHGESRRFKSYQARVKGVEFVRDRLSICTTALE